MADTKPTDLDNLGTAPATTDLIEIVDVSDTTDNAAGSSKTVTVSNLKSAVAQTGAEIKTAYEAESDTNAFTDADHSKLDGIEANATADQSDAEIETAYNNQVSQVSSGERTAGTETGVRRFSPADIASMAGTHGGGSGGDATSIQGTDVDSSVGSPSDGDILVYRSAGSDFVLEAKPAAGSNPAIADITDWPAGVDATEVGYLNGVTSALQTQLDAKEGTISRSGSDTDVVTGTAGTADNLVKWDSNGDAVDAGFGVTTGTPGKGSLLVGDGASDYDEVTAGSNDQIVVYDSGETNGVKKVDLDVVMTVAIDGGGSALTTGAQFILNDCPAFTIEQMTITGDVSGSVVVDIWKDTYANYPATDADSITASATPTLSSAQKGQDSTLTGWTTTVNAGDNLVFNVDSATTITRVYVTLRGKRTF